MLRLNLFDLDFDMKKALRQALGPLGWNKLSQTRPYQILREPSWYVLDQRARKSRQELNKLKDAHQGETCFIIGSGPSLLKTDLAKINGRFSIGLNRLYLGFEQFQFKPTYMACVNELLMGQWGQEFSELGIPLFTGWSSRSAAPDHSIFIRTQAGTDFSKDCKAEVFVGGTVTYVAMQLAFWMGFQTVVLLGIDHNYSFERHEKNKAANTISSRQQTDSNHFSKTYFGSGSKWQIPDLQSSELAYATANQVFKDAGREILDATIGGKLSTFEKCELASFF